MTSSTTSEHTIGTARLEADGALVLVLRATGDAIGDARVVYRPGDAHYDEVMAHVAPIVVGETKPVRPFDTR